MTTTEPRWLLRSQWQRVSCIISRFRCRVARLVQFGRFFLKRLGAPPKSTRQYHTDRIAWVSAHVIFRSQPGWSHMSAESAKEEGWSSWPPGQSGLFTTVAWSAVTLCRSATLGFFHRAFSWGAIRALEPSRHRHVLRQLATDSAKIASATSRGCPPSTPPQIVHSIMHT